MDLRAAARLLRANTLWARKQFASTASERTVPETKAWNSVPSIVGSHTQPGDLSELERVGKHAQSIRNAQKESQQSTDTYTRFPGSDYQAYVHTSKYAKWLNGPRRRESWAETVGRYFDFMEEHLRDQQGYIVPKHQRRDLESAVLALDVMPSMRALMTAGPALKKSGIAGYNCSYVPIDSLEAFHEILYILMHGTGVGFSVEQQFTDQLPVVPHRITASSSAIYIDDSREGWSRGLQQLLLGLYSGALRPFDTSDVRPEGSILKTFGGLASGPKPLHDLHEFAEKVFRAAAGRKLTPLECHDIVCKIGESVVVGGVRRSALISLSDLSDADMRDSKAGAWWERNSSRYMANNSAVYTERPSRERFDEEWASLVASGSGERGMFSRAAAAQQAARFHGRQTDGIAFGTNPCSEIILRPQQFCNLSEVVVRAEDSMEDLLRKVRVASTLGTWQATLTQWKEGGEGLRPQWRQNTVEERLLGVSLTGIMDNELTSGQHGQETLISALQSLRSAAVSENASQAHAIGITTATAVTCVKPSGTVSQLVDAASGIHPRHSRYYIRRVRGNDGDPLSHFLTESGIPSEPCAYTPGTQVFSFPMAAPKGAMVRDGVDAISHLQLCLDYQRHWCEHKPSVTISVRDSQWEEVGDWVYDHFDELAGVSFLPHDTGTYKQTPYEEIDEKQYDRLCAEMPGNIDWAAFQAVERGWRDFKVGAELACSTGECEVVGEPVDTTVMSASER